MRIALLLSGELLTTALPLRIFKKAEASRVLVDKLFARLLPIASSKSGGQLLSHQTIPFVPILGKGTRRQPGEILEAS